MIINKSMPNFFIENLKKKDLINSQFAIMIPTVNATNNVFEPDNNNWSKKHPIMRNVLSLFFSI